MPALKTISFAFLLILSFAAFAYAQEKPIVIDEAFTKEKDGFSIVLVSRKSSFYDDGPLVSKHLLSRHSYEWHLQQGSLVLSHSLINNAFCFSEKENTSEVKNVKDQLTGNNDFTLLSETKDKLGNFMVVKLVYKYKSSDRVSHTFYTSCSDEYWLYGFSRLNTPDDESAVIQAMNSFKIVK